MVPPYLRQDAGAEVGTFAEYGFEQTRPFRALKTWATIAARGRDGIVDQVVRANALARELAALVEREPSLELAAARRRRSWRSGPGRPAARRTGSRPSTAPCPRRSRRGRAFVTGTVYEERPARLHPAPGHDGGRPGDARRGGGRRRGRAGLDFVDHSAGRHHGCRRHGGGRRVGLRRLRDQRDLIQEQVAMAAPRLPEHPGDPMRPRRLRRQHAAGEQPSWPFAGKGQP